MVPIASAQSMRPRHLGSCAEQDRIVVLGHVQIADVDDELVHAHSSADREPVPVDRHRPDVGRVPRDAIGIAERDERERRVAVGRVDVPVGDTLAGVHPLHGREPGPQRHGWDEAELSLRGDGREAVDRDARTHEVEVRLGQRERRGRVGDVTHLRPHTE